MTKVKCANDLCGHWEDNVCILEFLELAQLADNGCTYIICTSFTEEALGIDEN